MSAFPLLLKCLKGQGVVVRKFQTVLQLPWLWIVVSSVVLFAYMSHRGELTLHQAPDSGGYTAVADQPISVDMLTQSRTIGYPLFLKASLAIVSEQYLPVTQFLLFVGSVLLFSFALRRIGISTLGNVCICIAILYKSKITDHVNYVLTDLPGYACAIATAACVLAIMKPRAHKGWWIGLCLTLFYSYQMRPVYLCLIPFAIISPIIGRYLYEKSHSEEARRSRLKFATGVVAVAVIPFFSFCTMRYLLVDHFGLVSFGGYNVVGIAGSLLDDDDVEHLSPQLQPLAKKILEKRNDAPTRASFNCNTSTWQPVVLKENKWDRISHADFSYQYNFVIWGVSANAAHKIVAAQSEDVSPQMQGVKTNQLLTTFSREVLSLHKADYSFLLAESLWASVVTVHQEIRLIYRVIRAWIVLLVCRMILSYFIKRKTGIAPVKNSKGLASASMVGIVSLLFFFSNVGLVIAVEPPIYRYLAAAAGLLPAIGMVFFFHEAEQIYALRTPLLSIFRGEKIDDAPEEVSERVEPPLKKAA